MSMAEEAQPGRRPGAPRGVAKTPERRAKRSRRLTAEHRAKLMAANIGRPLTEEHRAKLRAAMIGRSLTAEHRAKLRAAKLGRKYSDAHRAAISAGLKGHPGLCGPKGVLRLLTEAEMADYRLIRRKCLDRAEALTLLGRGDLVGC